MVSKYGNEGDQIQKLIFQIKMGSGEYGIWNMEHGLRR